MKGFMSFDGIEGFAKLTPYQLEFFLTSAKIEKAGDNFDWLEDMKQRLDSMGMI